MEITHEAQLEILKQLLYKPKSRFSQLNMTGLDNNHFSFHLKRLMEMGIVEKLGEEYSLTTPGLELAGRMDVKEMKFVRQPKVGVAIYVTSDGKILLGRRLRDPGKDKINFYTHKVKYGESIFVTAGKCLEEETGLEADFAYAGTIRFLNQNMDRLMIYIRATNIRGKLSETTIEAENKWYTRAQIKDITNKFGFFEYDLDLCEGKDIFFEERVEE